MIKRFSALIITLSILMMMSAVSAERWVSFADSNGYDLMLADLDSVSIKGDLNCTLSVRTMYPQGWSNGVINFVIDYDKKNIYYIDTWARFKFESNTNPQERK